MNIAINEEVTNKRSVDGTDPDILTNIFQEYVNITTWKREFSADLTSSIEYFLKHNQTKAEILAVTPDNTDETLCKAFGDAKEMMPLREDIALLVDMFCCLFDLKRVGLRVTILETAMYPRFHFDRIPCRLVTTYHGTTTQWLEHNTVDRSKLGAGNQGKSDEESGIFNSLDDINQLTLGDVALLKGEHWESNEGAGLVHRSPQVISGERRLMLTIDFI